MKIGDLVKVKMKYQEARTGIIVNVQRVGLKSWAWVQPTGPGLQIYADQQDMEVISASR